MELKFTNAERKSIANGNPSLSATNKLPGFVEGTIGGAIGLRITYNQSRLIPEVSTLSNKSMALTNDPNKFFNASLKKPETPPIEGKGWSYSAAVKANTNGGKLTNPITGKSSDTSFSASDQAGASSFGPWSQVAAWAGGGVLEGLGLIKSAEEHLAEAGTSTANINGIGYARQNAVNASKINRDYDRSIATDMLSNPFRAVTKLFGKSKAHREAENAALHANIVASGARDLAYTQFMRQLNALNRGVSEAQTLYNAADGKLPGFVGGKVYSAAGPINSEATARVSNGEIIANKLMGTAYRVPGIKNNADGKLAAISPSDTIITNKYGLSDKVASGQMTIDQAENIMAMMKNHKYKNGKLPGFAEGWLGNFIPSMIGVASGLGQIIDAYNNKPYRPNTYASNPYETNALSTLAGLRINPYPIQRQLRDAEARTNRAIDVAGGLGGGQRTMARLAALGNTQRNIADMLSKVQEQNNAYKSSYAQAALNAGAATRQARMQANQWDLDMYAKAHAARNKGIQTGIANMLSQMQAYQANEFKRRQFNDTMNLYRADQKQRKEEHDWMMKNMGNQATRGIGMNNAYYDPTYPRQYADDSLAFFGVSPLTPPRLYNYKAN